LLVLFVHSCAPKPARTLAPSEAEKKLINLCQSERGLGITTMAFARTLWVYLPLEHSYLDITSSKEGPVKSAAPQAKMEIKYLDGAFAGGVFDIRYDIRPGRSYTDSRGINTKVTEEYTAAQQFLFGALTRVYGDTGKGPDNGQAVETPGAPEFFVVVIADIEKGIETRMYVYSQDLRRASVDQGFGEEYVRRIVVDQPIGHDVIIGDKNGSHLNAYDLTWPDFLSKQMIYRVTFKYQQSAFPPSADTRSELLRIAADTVAAYDFTDFTSVKLRDLDTGAAFVTPRADLADYASEPSEGKLIHIRFQ
jgi:hypothetical protein